MFIKVQGGAVAGGHSPLCGTCRFATIIQGTSRHHDFTDCPHAGRIDFPVMSCSRYVDKRRPSLDDMEQIAWVLYTDVKRRKVGFVPARDLPPDQRVQFVED